MLKTLAMVLRTAMQPHGFGVMRDRVVERLRHIATKGVDTRDDAWCAANAQDQVDWAMQRSPELWREATEYAAAFEGEAQTRLASTHVKFGGAGATALLYFLVRWRRPEYVVETGVAAGWSSAAVLAAMERNGSGHLWSSDFHYFKQSGSRDVIGIVVPDHLRSRWTLYVDGDQVNLRRIIAAVPRIDMFHYDSDKSRAGRERGLRIVRPKLTPDAVIAFDDIQDNRHFHDLAGPEPVIFAEGGKYVGLLQV